MGLLAGRKREYHRADLPYYARDFPPPVDRDVVPHSDGPGVKRLSTVAMRQRMHCRRAVYQNFKVFPLSIEAVQHLRSCMGFGFHYPHTSVWGFAPWASSMPPNGCTLGTSLQSTHLQLKRESCSLALTIQARVKQRDASPIRAFPAE